VDDGEADDERDEEEDARGGGTHLEPLREKQGGEEEHGDEDREHEADDVRDHSPSTHFWIRPKTAKTATVNAMYTRTDMTRSDVYGPPDFGDLSKDRSSSRGQYRP
jgi:ABC-type Zn2+ transport system substrate-binding protein/surface adhesin